MNTVDKKSKFNWKFPVYGMIGFIAGLAFTGLCELPSALAVGVAAGGAALGLTLAYLTE